MTNDDPESVYRRLKARARPLARRIGLAAPEGAWWELKRNPWDTPKTFRADPAVCNICHWSGPAFSGPFHTEMADCPLCGSIARDRFLLHCFLSRVPYRRGLRVLETSPRMGAGYREMMHRHFDYTASDFDQSAHIGDIRLDLQDIALPSASVDVLLTPTSPTTAFGFGAHSEDPLAMYLADLLTIPANMAGLPAISLPCGFDGSGLPIGVQLITGVLQEERLLQVAHQYEQAARVMAQRPEAPLVAPDLV